MTPSEAELIAFAKERMAAYKYPRAIEFLDEIPKTVTAHDHFPDSGVRMSDLDLVRLALQLGRHGAAAGRARPRRPRRHDVTRP